MLAASHPLSMLRYKAESQSSKSQSAEVKCPRKTLCYSLDFRSVTNIGLEGRISGGARLALEAQ